MKLRSLSLSLSLSLCWMLPMLLAFSISASAEEPTPAKSAVQGIQGVKQDAVSNVKNIEKGSAANSGGAITSAPTNAPGVNKVNGVETINGVKAESPAIQPPPPPGTPPPPIVSAGGTTVPAGGGSVGSAAHIRAVTGVSGIDTAKLRNLEAALILKQPGNPVSANSGKGRAAAAGLLSAPLEKKTGPKEDGRAGFQEFEKLQNKGS